MGEATLILFAEDLLLQLVAAWEQAPADQRGAFGVSPSAGRLLAIYHPGLPNGTIGTAWKFVGELEAAGFLQVNNSPPLYAPYRLYFYLTTKGRDYVRQQQAAPKKPQGPRLFIVHGQDDKTKLEVKNFLQNRLRLPEPVVLHELPQRGRTIIEKFEEHAADVEGAVVLLTPDDEWREEGRDDELRRARQNVVFELGYFYGQFGRRSGRVLLLYKGKLDIPTDIAGIAYINISGGVEQVGEQIRRELLDPSP